MITIRRVIEKKEEKCDTKRSHIPCADSTMVEPFDIRAGRRCLLGVRERYTDQNCLGDFTMEDRLLKKFCFADLSAETTFSGLTISKSSIGGGKCFGFLEKTLAFSMRTRMC